MRRWQPWSLWSSGAVVLFLGFVQTPMAAPGPHATVTVYPTYTAPSATASTAPAAPSASPTQSFTDLVHRVKGAVVLITTYDHNDQKLGLGSGFFVAPTEIITNCHVVKGASRAEVKTLDGETLAVESVSSSNRDRDVIRLVVHPPHQPAIVLKIADRVPEDGEHILVVGNPLGLEQTVSDGIVSSTRELPKVGKVLQITAPVSPGNSGGPVVNMAGDVVGIVQMLIPAGQNLNFAVPAEEIARLPQQPSSTLAAWNSTLVVGARSEAVDVLKLWWISLDNKNYTTCWSLLTNASQKNMIADVMSSQRLDESGARSILDCSSGIDSLTFWDRYRDINQPHSMVTTLYQLRSEDGDKAIVDVGLNSTTDKTLIPYLMFRENGQWKWGHIETWTYNHSGQH